MRILSASWVALAVLGVGAPCARADFMFVYGGHSYFGVTAIPASWQQAAANAGKLNFAGQIGYLAHIENAAENAAIIANLLSNIPAAQFSMTIAKDGGGKPYVWIGAQDLTKEGNWIWDGDFDGMGPLIGTGQGFDSTWMTAPGAFQNWGLTPGTGVQREPDNSQNFQHAAGISLNGWPFGSAGEWNDVNSANALFYLVEVNAVIPEPSSAVLLAGGLVLLATYVGIGRRVFPVQP